MNYYSSVRCIDCPLPWLIKIRSEAQLFGRSMAVMSTSRMFGQRPSDHELLVVHVDGTDERSAENEYEHFLGRYSENEVYADLVVCYPKDVSTYEFRLLHGRETAWKQTYVFTYNPARSHDYVAEGLARYIFEKRKPEIATVGKARAEAHVRVRAVAAELEALRINTIGPQIERLRTIADELERHESPLDDSHARRALSVIGELFDVLDEHRSAQILVSGAVAGIVAAYGGWPGVAASALTTAVWFGKDAYLAAVDALPKIASAMALKKRDSTPKRKLPRPSKK